MYSYALYSELVRKEKILAFLEANKGGTSKNNEQHIVGIQTYLAYVNAIVDLYQTQVHKLVDLIFICIDNLFISLVYLLSPLLFNIFLDDLQLFYSKLAITTLYQHSYCLSPAGGTREILRRNN